jgi:hypothetical protein
MSSVRWRWPGSWVARTAASPWPPPSVPRIGLLCAPGRLPVVPVAMASFRTLHIVSSVASISRHAARARTCHAAGPRHLRRPGGSGQRSAGESAGAAAGSPAPGARRQGAWDDRLPPSISANCFASRLPFTRDGDDFIVTPPSYRFDIEIEEDLIEEIARLHGYENIPAAAPQGSWRCCRRPSRHARWHASGRFSPTAAIRRWSTSLSSKKPGKRISPATSS